MAAAGDDGNKGRDTGHSTAPTLASGEGGSAAAAPTPAPADEIDMHADTAIGETGENAAPTGETPPVDESLVGQTLRTRYEIMRKIGQGGMGAVYEAKDSNLGGKRVAVKVLLDKYAQKDQVVARLKQEARLASSIGHANIINITDFGNTVDGRTFVVMEFLEGESLGQCLNRETALTEYRAIRIARQCASALGAAHKKGIVHRDIKPENIFLEHRGDDDYVKVVDFGISKSMRPEEDGTDSPRLTQTGMVLGTPLYMSPEQARGDEDLDHRIDIYAIGVILYEMVTGEVPFRGTNYLNILTQVVSTEPTPPRELKPQLSKEIEAVIQRALEKDPDDRYQTMAELDEDLAALEKSGSGIISTAARITASRRRRKRAGTTRKVLMWAGGLGIVAACIGVYVTMTMDDEPEPDNNSPVVVVPRIDAAAEAVQTADAAPAKPDIEVVVFQFATVPSNATIWNADTEICGPTPCEGKFAKENKEYELTAEAEGLIGHIRLNPLTSERVVKTRLKKPPKGTEIRKRPPRRPPKDTPDKGDDRPKDKPRDDTAGGDLTRPDFGKK